MEGWQPKCMDGIDYSTGHEKVAQNSSKFRGNSRISPLVFKTFVLQNSWKIREFFREFLATFSRPVLYPNLHEMGFYTLMFFQ